MHVLLHSVSQPCSRPPLTHASTGDSRTVTDKSRSVSCGVIAPLSWVLVHTRFCLCSPRVYFPVLCKFWQLYGGGNGDLLQEGLCHTQVCCTESPHPCGSPLMTCTSTWDVQTQFCLSLCGVLRAHSLEQPKLKMENAKYWQGCQATVTIKHCLWGVKMVQPFWKRVLHPPKMLSINLLCDPAITLQSVYKEAVETYVHTKNCTWIFITKETIQTSIKRSIDNQKWYIWIMEYLLSNKIYTLWIHETMWMNLKFFLLGKGSQAQKSVYSLILSVKTLESTLQSTVTESISVII